MKRYSAPILPYLAEKLTEQGFITFLQRLTHALRHKITHTCIQWATSAGGYTSTKYAFTVCCPLFELIDLLLLKDSISEGTTAGKQIGVHHLKCGHYATIWSACCNLRTAVTT